MERISLSVEQRFETGKGPARRLRATGKVPAILYGPKSEPVKLALDAREFAKTIGDHGARVIFDLVITGPDGSSSTRPGMLKERQIRPYDGALVHLDFLEIQEDKPLVFTVALKFEGIPETQRKSAAMQVQAREVKISCIPANVPREIIVNCSGLVTGDTLRASALGLPEGSVLVTEPDKVLASMPAAGSSDSPEEAE